MEKQVYENIKEIKQFANKDIILLKPMLRDSVDKKNILIGNIKKVHPIYFINFSKIKKYL